MKIKLAFICLITLLGIGLSSCGKPSAKDVASKFCGMMEKYHNASSDNEKKKIHDEMEAFESKIKKSYQDKDYQKDIKKEINICMDELETKYGDIER